MRKARFALAVLALVSSGLGCTDFRAPNAALEEWSPDYGYRPHNLRKHHPVGRVALLMAFSGSGTRRLYLQLLNPVNWFRMLTTLSRAELGIDRPLDIVVVVVDAQVNPKKRFDLSPSSPGLGELLGIITGSQLNHFSFETIELTRSSLAQWADQLDRSGKGPPVKTHLIEVSFAMSGDPEERAYLNELPTSFDLEDEQVDRLIEFGRRTFRTSPDTKMLLDRLDQ